MTRRIERNLALACVILSALAMAGSVGPNAYALPKYATTTDYYSDESFENHIGVKVLNCDGSVQRYGTTYGAHSRVESMDPCGGGDIVWVCYIVLGTSWTIVGCP
jgi:hypothetical protein